MDFGWDDELEEELHDRQEENLRLNDELEEELHDEMLERLRLNDELEEELHDEMLERQRLDDEFEERLDDEWDNNFNAARPIPISTSGTSITPTSLHNSPSAPPLMTHPAPESPDLLGPDAPACERLIRGSHSPQQLVSLIEAIFTSTDEVAMIRDLRGEDAQTFVDVVNEVRSASSPFRGIV